MKKIKWTLDAGFGPGAQCTGELEIDDDATEEDIREACLEEARSYLVLWWEEE